MNPEVSVIIPAFNTEAYIAQAIDSALRQTRKNIEVIVVDDRSTDSTVKVARQFSDHRIKVFLNERNSGPSHARNRALREARGKWIALLDSDDWYGPERLEKLLVVAYAEKADMVADDLYFIHNGSESPWDTLLARSGERIDGIRHIDAVRFVETNRYAQRGLHLGQSKPIIRRAFLLEQRIQYDETIIIVEDFCFYLDCLVNGARFVLVPQPYYFYRSRPDSLVTTGKVIHLNQGCRAARIFLAQTAVENNHQLRRALSKNLAIFERNRAYYRVMEPLKRRELLVALIAMVRNPYFFIHFLLRLPSLLMLRLRRARDRSR